jgi:hypothetical protein
MNKKIQIRRREMECYVCGKNTTGQELCLEHVKILVTMLTKGEGVISHPDWRNHCAICGEFENRIIVEYPLIGYFCNKDILEIADRYQKESKGTGSW